MDEKMRKKWVVLRQGRNESQRDGGRRGNSPDVKDKLTTWMLL